MPHFPFLHLQSCTWQFVVAVPIFSRSPSLNIPLPFSSFYQIGFCLGLPFVSAIIFLFPSALTHLSPPIPTPPPRCVLRRVLFFSQNLISAAFFSTQWVFAPSFLASYLFPFFPFSFFLPCVLFSIANFQPPPPFMSGFFIVPFGFRCLPFSFHVQFFAPISCFSSVGFPLLTSI